MGIINGPGSLLDRLYEKKDCLELQRYQMQQIYILKEQNNMGEYNYNTIKDAVFEWYSKLNLKKYAAQRSEKNDSLL